MVAVVVAIMDKVEAAKELKVHLKQIGFVNSSTVFRVLAMWRWRWRLLLPRRWRWRRWLLCPRRRWRLRSWKCHSATERKCCNAVSLGMWNQSLPVCKIRIESQDTERVLVQRKRWLCFGWAEHSVPWSPRWLLCTRRRWWWSANLVNQAGCATPYTNISICCDVFAVSVARCCFRLTEVDTMRKVEVVEAEEPARCH